MTAAKTFDVFLSHNSKDKPAVERLAQKLQREGLEPWLDKWALTPGGQWQNELATGIRVSSACAVFVGPNGLGAWENEELSLALDRAAKDRSFRLFLVLLPGLPEPFDANTLPPFLSTRTWIDLRGGIENTRPFQLLINAIKGVAPGSDSPVEKRDDVCPYRGLRTFDEEHAEFFFGRDSDVQRLVEKLKSTRFLAVIGASGSGKSSVVRAGLIPALKHGVLPESRTWAIRVLTPGAHPLTSLAAQLLRLYQQDAMQKTLDQMMDDTRSLHLAVSLAMADRPSSERVVWVIDQFEEVFTLCRDAREREQFFSNLLYAASIPDGRNIVLITMRADFYQKCAAYSELSARIAAQQSLVSPMEQDGLRQAIEEPAWRVGLEFEQGLVPTILEDLANQPGALPLLEHALLELWERRRGRMLTLEAYRESGGVDGAIAARADAIWESLGEGEQAIVRHIMLRLTQPGDGTEDTRRHAAMSELITNASEVEALENVVRTLADARLLMTGTDEQSGEEVVDVSHEALIRGWPRLRRWIDEDRVGLRVHRRLTEAAQEWQRMNRDEGLLYRGARLAQTVEWRERNQGAMNELEKDFLNASVALQMNERLIAQRRTRRTVIGLTVALVLISLFGVVAVRQYLHAARERDESRSRELAANALSELPLDPELALLISMEAASLSPTTQAEDALIECLAESDVLMVMQGRSGGLYRSWYSADGNRVVTGSLDGIVRVWDVNSGESMSEGDKKGQIIKAAFTPDGKYVMAADVKGNQRLLDSVTGSEVKSFQNHSKSLCFSPDGQFVIAEAAKPASSINIVEVATGRVVSTLNIDGGFQQGIQAYCMAFSPDGKLVAGTNELGAARVWDAGTGRALSKFEGVEGGPDYWLNSPFSADSKFIVFSTFQHDVRVWDATSGTQISEMSGHDSDVNSAVFSPDATKVATASADHTARIWDAKTGKLISSLSDHTGGVHSAAFSLDGKMVVTASGDRSARVWDAATGQLLKVLRGHLDDVITAMFSPDGKSVLTASMDNTARVWSLREAKNLIELQGHSQNLTSINISPDARLAVTTSLDGTACIWSATDGQLLKELRGHDAAVRWGDFSSDGKRVVTVGDDQTAIVWDAGSGQILSRYGTPAQPAANVVAKDAMTKGEFSPDGKLLLVQRADGTADIFESGTGRMLARLGGSDHGVKLAYFNPNSDLVMTIGVNSSARIWKAATGEVVTELKGESANVNNGAFSPDGRRLAIVYSDGTISVLEVGTWKKNAEIRGSQYELANIEFSPDGKSLLTGESDNFARIWDAATGEELIALRGHASPVFTASFSRDGRYIFSQEINGFARMWQASRGLILAEFHQAQSKEGVNTPGIVVPSSNGKFVITSKEATAQIHFCELCGSVDELIALGRSRVTRQLTPEERKKHLNE